MEEYEVGLGHPRDGIHGRVPVEQGRHNRRAPRRDCHGDETASPQPSEERGEEREQRVEEHLDRERPCRAVQIEHMAGDPRLDQEQ